MNIIISFVELVGYSCIQFWTTNVLSVCVETILTMFSNVN